MHHGGPLRVPVGSHRGQKGGDAGADILSHDDGDGGGIADLSRHRQRLQDAYGGGAGLNHAGQHSARQHAQDRIFEGQKQLGKGGHIPQPRHGGAHGLHAEHQRGKAQKDGAGVPLFAVFAVHVEENTQQG